MKSYYLLLAVFGGMHQNRTCCFSANRCNVTFRLIQQLILQNFATFQPQEEIQCAFLVNEEINIVCTVGSTALVGKRTQKQATKGTILVVMHPLRWEININSSFSGLTQVSTKAAHKLTYSKGNLISLFCVFFFGLPALSIYYCNTFHF